VKHTCGLGSDLKAKDTPPKRRQIVYGDKRWIMQIERYVRAAGSNNCLLIRVKSMKEKRGHGTVE
jgi:hypothetical protein